MRFGRRYWNELGWLEPVAAFLKKSGAKNFVTPEPGVLNAPGPDYKSLFASFSEDKRSA
jgi:hypothetical protein